MEPLHTNGSLFWLNYFDFQALRGDTEIHRQQGGLTSFLLFV
jgi:hypothetical protein